MCSQKQAIGLFPTRDIQLSTRAILFFGAAKNMGLECLGTVLAIPGANLSEEMRNQRWGYCG